MLINKINKRCSCDYLIETLPDKHKEHDYKEYLGVLIFFDCPNCGSTMSVPKMDEVEMIGRYDESLKEIDKEYKKINPDQRNLEHLKNKRDFYKNNLDRLRSIRHEKTRT